MSIFKKITNSVKDTFTSSSFEISEDMIVSDLKQAFHKSFGVSLRIYNGAKFAADNATLASLRKSEGKAKKLTIRANMLAGDVEEAFMVNYNLKVQVADAANQHLAPDDRTLGEIAREEYDKPSQPKEKPKTETPQNSSKISTTTDMADIRVSGNMRVKTLQAQVKEAYGCTLRVYNGARFADSDATLASIRSDDAPKGGELTIRGNMQCGNFCKSFLETFGIKVRIADPANTYLADDGITLSAAGKLAPLPPKA